jgi:peptide/nickel transport system substrate-binding protein
MTGDYKRRAALALLVIGILAAAGCNGSDVVDKTGRGNTVVISSASSPENLFPPSHTGSQAAAVADLIFEKLVDIGPELQTLGDKGRVPRLAERWEWSADSMSVVFHLNPRAKWHDGAPVRAGDVRFALAVFGDKKLASSRGQEILAVVDSISVQDSLTFTAWFRTRTPERFHLFTYNLKPLPEHILGKMRPDSILTSSFAQQPVGNGPFKMARFDHGQQLELAANDSFFLGRPSVDRVIWTFVTTNNVAVQRVMTGEADFIERVSFAEIREAAANADLKTVPAASAQYGYILFNQYDRESNRPHPIFSDRGVRRALTMAIDRRALVANVFDSLGKVALGPFIRSQWSADTTLNQIPFDREGAKKTLDSLGWRVGSDSIREKNGRKLAFSLLTPESSLPRVQSATILQEQWRQIGVKLNVEVTTAPVWQQQTLSRQFEASYMQLGPDPSPTSVRQSWTSAGAVAGSGLNAGRYANATVDKAFATVMTQANLDSARAQYRLAYQTLLDEAAALWIYEVRVYALANTRLDTGTLRPDAWWTSIPSWRVNGGSAR